MMISTRGRYALRVMLDLAMDGTGTYVPLDSIARREGMSEKYLESILAVLSRAGLVQALRGKGGGYRLSRRPEEYPIGEVLRLTEKSLAPVTCLEPGTACPQAQSCPTFPLWQGLDKVIDDYLMAHTLADLLPKGGGYRLTRKPEEYPIGEILRLTEKSLAPVTCLEEGMDCPQAESCPTLPLWQGLDRVIEEYLMGRTLADLLPPEKQ